MANPVADLFGIAVVALSGLLIGLIAGSSLSGLHRLAIVVAILWLIGTGLYFLWLFPRRITVTFRPEE